MWHSALTQPTKKATRPPVAPRSHPEERVLAKVSRAPFRGMRMGSAVQRREAPCVHRGLDHPGPLPERRRLSFDATPRSGAHTSSSRHSNSRLTHLLYARAGAPLGEGSPGHMLPSVEISRDRTKGPMHVHDHFGSSLAKVVVVFRRHALWCRDKQFVGSQQPPRSLTST